MGLKCLWSKATDQAPDAKTDIAFCGQGGVLAGSDIRAANQDGAVRPLGNDVDIAASFDGAATCAVTDLCCVALAFAGAHAARDGWSVVLERTVRELQGVSCMSMETAPAAKKQIACTRSFSPPSPPGHQVIPP